ncbi:MAG: alpha/beta fold hydrolase [Bdellovibrionaceae bacterium]|nr:alpha/beta fold hydrolase [Pseudobdellovibrionaceae bacterium]NUM57661.1 alpha/beta fold hydrolase [Pseudobdellovibrionaceae bacterium]
MKENISSFGRPFWDLHPHSQTLFGHLKKEKPIRENFEKIILDTLDGDKLLLKTHRRNPKKWVILAHGLAGSSESSYINRFTAQFLTKQISVLRFNHRNCGDSMGLSRKPYHSGRGEDLLVAVKYLQDHYPQCEIVLVGFSLSGNVVLDALCRFENEMNIKLAVCVNGPIDLKASAARLSLKENSIYNFYFLNLLRIFNFKLYQKGLLNLSFKESVAKLPLDAKLIEYDDLYTAPLSGYKNAMDYYEQCSTIKKISKINTATVLITAEDDPIIPVSSYQELLLPKNVERFIQPFGGHLGYMVNSSTPYGNKRWLDWFLGEKISNALK